MKIEILEIDVSTGKEKLVESYLSEKEISNAEKIRLEREVYISNISTARQALLNKLGITEEEARLLLGGN